jgi:hypothetical protein
MSSIASVCVGRSHILICHRTARELVSFVGKTYRRILNASGNELYLFSACFKCIERLKDEFVEVDPSNKWLSTA